MSEGYHSSRFVADARRDVLWETLCESFFNKRVPADGCVLDLGSGYGQFINNVRAGRKIAVDQWSGLAEHTADDVTVIVGDVTDLSKIDDGSVDFAFASNLFEHLSQDDLSKVLAQLKQKLSRDGTLTILQPNYRYATREYFDDYTHVSIYSHISLADFLATNGFEVLEVWPRFLPLTLKSRLPVWPWLIRLYLALPFKPMGKQMLLVARPARGDQ